MVSLFNGEIQTVYYIPLFMTIDSTFQYRIEPSIWQDMPDYFKHETQLDLEIDQSNCVPLYTRTNMRGQVQVVFKNPIGFV